MLCSVLFCSVLFCSVLFCPVLSCPVLFCSVLFCSVLFCSVLLCSVMLCYVMLCYVMTTVNSLHVRESKTVLDSKFHSLESRSPDTGFQIPSVSGSWIQDFSR